MIKKYSSFVNDQNILRRWRSVRYFPVALWRQFPAGGYCELYNIPVQSGSLDYLRQD